MQPVKKLVRLAPVFCILLTLLLSGSAGATTFVRVADSDLVDQAPLIAEVIVRDFDYSVTPNMPVTDYRVDVVRVLRGQAPGSVIVRVHGGRTADGMELEIYGAPKFAADEKVLLFLSPASDGTYRILHILQGVFREVQSAGQTYAVRDFGDAEELEIAGRVIESERPRDLSRFTSWISDRLVGEERPADYFLTEDPSQPSSIKAKYTLLNRNGVNMRWSSFDASQNVNFLAHEAGQPGRTGGGFSDLQTAINVWNDEAVTNIRYRYGGTTTVTEGFKNFDGINAVVWDNLDDAGEFENPFSCASGGTLAIGGPWFNSTVKHTYLGKTFITIQGADIVTNDGLECWINFSRRLEEVLAHELGHTLGLNHSCGDDESGSCNTSVKNEALMRAQAHGDSRGASLRSDDLAGINILYGTGEDPQPPNAPSQLQASPLDGGIRLVWLDNSSDETDFLIERRSTGSFQQISSVGTGTTVYQDDGVLTGISYTYRVRALNDAGASDYSNEASAKAEGEQAPSNLGATANSPTTAQLAWTDNSTSESSFDVEAKISGGTFEVVANLPANTFATTVTGLFPESNYTFRVRAKGGLGTSGYSNDALATTPATTAGTCVPSLKIACLNQGRFEVEVRWRDFAGQTGLGDVVQASQAEDSGLFYFFDSANWEVLIKVLDGCAVNNRYWIFAAATTNVEYTLRVTDTGTGRTKVYTNSLGTSAAAITDTNAFDTCPTELQGGQAASVAAVEVPGAAVASLLASKEPADLLLKATCTDTETGLCVQNERFKVEVTWTDFVGQSGPGHVVPLGTADSGLFYFFTPNNWEMLVKVLDGCAINNRVWVFAAATTNVQYTLTVTDADTGLSKSYNNALGVSSPAITDTDAFAACP